MEDTNAEQTSIEFGRNFEQLGLLHRSLVTNRVGDATTLTRGHNTCHLARHLCIILYCVASAINNIKDGQTK